MKMRSLNIGLILLGLLLIISLAAPSYAQTVVSDDEYLKVESLGTKEFDGKTFDCSRYTVKHPGESNDDPFERCESHDTEPCPPEYGDPQEACRRILIGPPISTGKPLFSPIKPPPPTCGTFGTGIVPDSARNQTFLLKRLLDLLVSDLSAQPAGAVPISRDDAIFFRDRLARAIGGLGERLRDLSDRGEPATSQGKQGYYTEINTLKVALVSTGTLLRDLNAAIEEGTDPKIYWAPLVDSNGKGVMTKNGESYLLLNNELRFIIQGGDALGDLRSFLSDELIDILVHEQTHVLTFESGPGYDYFPNETLAYMAGSSVTRWSPEQESHRDVGFSNEIEFSHPVLENHPEMKQFLQNSLLMKNLNLAMYWCARDDATACADVKQFLYMKLQSYLETFKDPSTFADHVRKLEKTRPRWVQLTNLIKYEAQKAHSANKRSKKWANLNPDMSIQGNSLMKVAPCGGLARPCSADPTHSRALSQNTLVPGTPPGPPSASRGPNAAGGPGNPAVPGSNPQPSGFGGLPTSSGSGSGCPDGKIPFCEISKGSEKIRVPRVDPRTTTQLNADGNSSPSATPTIMNMEAGDPGSDCDVDINGAAVSGTWVCE